jgi:hypothetical protein
MNQEELKQIVEEEYMTFVPEFLKLTTEPGIYEVLLTLDGEVQIRSTFSGDNSYIPGDTRIQLMYADVREFVSLLDVGLDEDGDIIDWSSLALPDFEEIIDNEYPNS